MQGNARRYAILVTMLAAGLLLSAGGACAETVITTPTDTPAAPVSSAPTVSSASTGTAAPTLSSASTGTSAAPEAALPVLTLGQCIDTALKNNPAIVAAGYNSEVSRSRVWEARSSYYPQVSAQAGYSRISPIPGTSANTGDYNWYTSSVSVSQNLLDFGKTSSTVDVAKYNYASSQSDLSTTQDSVILSVKQAYYGVLQAQRNREVAKDVIKQFQLHLDQAKGFYDVGTKAKIDVIKAEVDLSNAQLSLINAENALKIAWVTLKNVMGVPQAPDAALEDSLAFQKYEITLEQASNRAYENRPDLKSIVAKRQAAERNVDSARTGYYPTLTGSAAYNWAGTTATSLDPVSSSDRGWNAGVLLTVPLFSGFLTSNQLAEAKSNLYMLKAQEEAVRQQILLDVRQAYLNLQAAEASIQTAELAAKQAKENLDLANGRYAAGVGSPIEVSDAFATYVTAQANFTNALANYKIAQASIEKAMGAR